MRWRKPADRTFVQASISAFREESEQALAPLFNLPAKAWQASDYWLDASGLALYLYDLVSRNSMLRRIPSASMQQLRSNLRKNRARTEGLFSEFVAINDSFTRQGIQYANHKGFTLCPHACPKPELRHQLDLDFLVAPEHLCSARECLEERGYRLSAATDRTWEFKAGDVIRRKRWDNYTLGTYRSVELHFGTFCNSDGHLAHDDRFRRLGTWRWRGKSFPSLSPPDQLLGQALHLLSHFRNESTRASWLLEFRRHVRARHDDAAFWSSVIGLAKRQSHAAMAFGLSTLIASKMFGRFAPPLVETWAMNSLPQSVQLWGQRYGVEAVLADFPGSKLYLLLEVELELLEKRRPKAMRTRLFPVRSFPSCFAPADAESLSDKLRRYSRTARFALFRLRFHGTEALRIAMELPAWRRLVRACAAGPNHGRTAVLEMTTRKQVHDNLPASSS